MNNKQETLKMLKSLLVLQITSNKFTRNKQLAQRKRTIRKLIAQIKSGKDVNIDHIGKMQ